MDDKNVTVLSAQAEEIIIKNLKEHTKNIENLQREDLERTNYDRQRRFELCQEAHNKNLFHTNLVNTYNTIQTFAIVSIAIFIITTLL